MDYYNVKMRIGLIDPSLGTSNLGDIIISKAVKKQLSSYGVNPKVVLPSHRKWTETEIRFSNDVDLWIVAGSNLMSSHLLAYNQWKTSRAQRKILSGKTVMLGVGWWQYQSKPDLYTKWTYSKLFSNALPQGLRDEYSLSQTKHITENSLNIGCATIWDLENGSLREGNGQVVLTLTDYMKDPEQDKKIIEYALTNFETVKFWAAGKKDIQYLKNLGYSKKVQVLDRTLDALDTEYVNGVSHFGTRLHAGIRALQFNCRSLIFAVDNRATEMGTDFNLPVVSRVNCNFVKVKIPTELSLKMPRKDIDLFMQKLVQFSN